MTYWSKGVLTPSGTRIVPPDCGCLAADTAPILVHERKQLLVGWVWYQSGWASNPLCLCGIKGKEICCRLKEMTHFPFPSFPWGLLPQSHAYYN